MNATLTVPTHTSASVSNSVSSDEWPTLPATAEILIRKPHVLIERIQKGGALHELLLQLVVLSAIGFGAFGLVIGLNHSLVQGLLSAPKLVFVGLGSLAVCLPSLFVYGRLMGNRSSAREVVGEALCSIATTGMSLLALCPIVLVFERLISGLKVGYFFNVLGVAAFLTFGCMRGIWVLYHALRMSRRPTAHLLVWTALFGLVGLQSAWMVRPLIGTPKIEGTALFRPLERTAYEALFHTFESATSVFFSSGLSTTPTRSSPSVRTFAPKPYVPPADNFSSASYPTSKPEPSQE